MLRPTFATALLASSFISWPGPGSNGLQAVHQRRPAFAPYILNNIIGSVRMNPQWEARQAQTTRDISGAVTRALHQMAASIAQQAREQASHDQIDVMSGWEARNKTMDSIRERRSEAFTGTRTANDDYLGVSHTVTNDFDYYWTRPDGSFARTNTDTPPTTAMAGA
jgi:hypothetical protein